ncbi:MAG: hypothetical protein RLZZ306_3540, partial [Bacteroidota bacterium]
MKKIVVILLVSCLCIQSWGQTILLDNEALSRNKKLISEKDSAKLSALKMLLKKANKIVKEGKLYSVMHKKKTPPSGDKHDYMSQAPYWWADSTKKNGLPYIR